MFVDGLKRSLQLKDSELIGCIRQNRWREEPLPWGFLRGNALCSLVGLKIRGYSPAGEFDVFLRHDGDLIVLFRGGRWKEWWNEDIYLLAALSKLYISSTLKGAIVLHELDNKLEEVYVTAPSTEEAKVLVQTALDNWMASKRIRKDSPRARAYCFHCPVKKQCDSTDLQEGEDRDWPADYRAG